MKIYQSQSERPILDWQWYEPSLRNITYLIMKHVPPANGRALDVGCGTGRVSFQLAERGYDVDAIDIEPRIIDIAQQIEQSRQSGCSFRVANFSERQEARKNYYDLIVCSEVLEHIDNYQPLIENMHTSLKPGGRLIITVPYDMRKFSILDAYGGHVRRFELDQIKADMASFSSIKTIITGFPFYRLMVRAYLFMNHLQGGEHSNETLWEKPSTRIIARLAYPFMRLDNFFAFTHLGDALIVIAKK